MAVKTIGEGYYGISGKNVTADAETYKRIADVFKTTRPERPTYKPESPAGKNEKAE